MELKYVEPSKIYLEAGFKPAHYTKLVKKPEYP